MVRVADQKLPQSYTQCPKFLSEAAGKNEWHVTADGARGNGKNDTLNETWKLRFTLSQIVWHAIAGASASFFVLLRPGTILPVLRSLN